MITPDLLAPLGVTVLDADQIRLPEKDGLLKWLATHPDGYVQIEEPIPIGTDGQRAAFWITVAAVAPTRAQAQALSDQAHRLIAGDSLEPSHHPLRAADRARQTLPGVYVCRPAYELTTLDGEPVA